MNKIIEKTLELLSNNNEWKERYAKYIKYIKGKQRKGFNKPEGLSVYTSVSMFKKNLYDLRFDGQSVGTLEIKSKEFLLPKNKANLRYFGAYGYRTTKDKMKWISSEATEFRKFYKDLSKKRILIKLKSPEHRVENRLLMEFAKRTRAENKALTDIQPITLDGSFFQMPTPLKASSHEPTYAKQNGGGIDILARIKLKGKSRICVMEVKDENKDSESQALAMEQALSYATFIACLLKCKSGQDWWDFFMGRRSRTETLPSNLDIDVVTIMPKGNTEEFSDKQIEVCGLATFHCHSLYYNDDAFANGLGSFVFSGSFPEQWD